MRDPACLPPTWPPAYPRHRPVEAAQARALDESAAGAHGIPPLVLMEHAAAGLAALVAALLEPGEATLVLCGPGNNGGDGYGLARFLASWGRPVACLALAPPAARPDAAALLEGRLAAMALPVGDAHAEPGLLGEALARRPALVVDALFGVGLTRPLGAPWAEAVALLNASGGPVLAVDLPSGLEADSGRELGVAVRARVTAAMGLPKPAHALRPDLCGRVVEVDIGLPRALHAPWLLDRPLPGASPG